MSVKRQRPQRKYRLGQTGIVSSRDDDKSDARVLFLQMIELHAPAVLQDFQKQVYDPWNERPRRTGAPIPEYLRRSIRDWAIRWNLTWRGQPAGWVVGQVDSTLSDWVTNPKLVGRSWGTFPGSSGNRPVVHLFKISEVLMVLPGTAERDSPWDRIEQRALSVVVERTRKGGQFTFEKAVVEVLAKHPELYNEYVQEPAHQPPIVACMPTAYSRQQIREALLQLKANVQDVMKHINSDRKFREYLETKGQLPPLKKARSIDKVHFVWAVRFQCLGHTYTEIAASQDINWLQAHHQLDDEKLAGAASAQPAIAAGIRDILTLVELTRRGGNKVGLPKRSKEKSRP